MVDETPNNPIPPELAKVDDVVTPQPPPATRKELMTAVESAVASIIAAQTLQDKYGFAVVQLHDQMTRQSDPRIIFLKKGLDALSNEG